MAKQILIRPIITEKATQLAEQQGKYSFVVDKRANKIEIKKAVEAFYNVQVQAVNTHVLPAKVKRRNTRSGVLLGRVSGYKKAIVTLAPGEEIDFYGDI